LLNFFYIYVKFIGITFCSDIESSSSCKYLNEQGEKKDLEDNFYCIFTDGKFYISSNNSCSKINDKEILIKDNSNLYKKGTIGEQNGLIFSCDDSKCTQYISSYYLFNDESNLYNCDNTGNCEIVKSINKGFYLSGSTNHDSLIYCREEDITSCDYYSIKPGYYVNASVFMGLIYCSSNECITFNSSTGIHTFYYLDGSNSANLIICNNSGCKSDKALPGYYTNNGRQNTNDLLIHCKDEKCEVVENKVGYYLNAGKVDNKSILIKCTENYCNSINSISGYYLNSGSTDKSDRIIRCNESSCSTIEGNIGYYPNIARENYDDRIIECSEKKCILIGGDTGFYINGDGEYSSKYLIDCANYYCQSVIPSPGYYVNNGLDKNDNQIIKCTSSHCETVHLKNSSSCSKSGQIILNNNQVKLCTSTNIKEAILIKNDNSSGSIFETITLDADDDFPNGQAGSNLIKISHYGYIVLSENSSIRPCETISPSNKCFDNDVNYNSCMKDDKVYYSNGKSCEQIALNTLKMNNQVLYFTDDHTLEINPTYRSVEFSYKCSINDNEMESCELLKGYSILNSNVINCNGIKHEKCQIIPQYVLKPCISGDEGKLGQSYDLCFGEKSFPLPLENNEVTIAFSTTKTSEIYGKEKDSIILLSLSSTSVSITNVEGNKKYI